MSAAKVCVTGLCIGGALTVGSGGSGGVFVPALFAGATLGGAFGVVAGIVAPGQASPPGAYALVGMSALFAAAAHAPMTGIILLLELTDNYAIILPLMGATVLATLISQGISPHSLYTAPLHARGIAANAPPEVNPLEAVTVREAMDEAFERVSHRMRLDDLEEKFHLSHERGFVVVDEAGELRGVVTLRDLEEALLNGKDPDTATVEDICEKRVVVCRPDQTLSEALALFDRHSFGRIPVIDPENPRRAIGVLRRVDILNAYLEMWRKGPRAIHRHEEVLLGRESRETVPVTAHVRAGAPAAFQKVSSLAFPEGGLLGLIHRGGETLMPRGGTVILPGDELVVLTTRDREDAIREWLSKMA